MKVWRMFGFVFIFLIFMCSSYAENFGTFEINSPINLIQTCTTCTYINITSITSPNSSLVLSNVPMTKTGSLYNYTLSSQSIIGQYIVCGVGDIDAVVTDWCYTFEITQTGKVSQNWIVLFIGLGILILIFIILTIWSVDNHPFLANFWFLLTFWFSTILSNLLWRYAYEASFLYVGMLLMIYRIMLIISWVLTLIILIMLMIEVIQVRKLEGNPVDNYRDNLGKNE